MHWKTEPLRAAQKAASSINSWELYRVKKKKEKKKAKGVT